MYYKIRGREGWQIGPLGSCMIDGVILYHVQYTCKEQPYLVYTTPTTRTEAIHTSSKYHAAMSTQQSDPQTSPPSSQPPS